MICSNCEHQNPESNKFCGMCGNRLAPAESQQLPAQDATPVENTSGARRPFIVSTTAMADITAQMLNSRVVLPSPTLASTHSGYVSPLKPNTEQVYQDQTLRAPEPTPMAVEEPAAAEEEQQGTVHEIDLDSPEEAEAERWLEQTAAEHESRMPPPSSSVPYSGSILGLSAPTGEAPHMSEGAHDAEPAPDRNSFLYIEEPGEQRRSSDVSGPSFLGLGSNDVSYEEEQPSGRGRLYLLMAMLAIVVVLGVLEWRASQNGDSTNPMDVLHLKLPKKKGQGQVEVMPPSSAPNGSSSAAPTANANPSATNATTDSGASKLSETEIPAAGPKPTQDNGSPNTAAPEAQNPPKAQEPARSSAAAPTSAAPEPAKTAAVTSKPPVKSAEVADARPAASASKPSAAPAKATKPVPSTPAVAAEPAPEPDASLNGGAAELQRGVAAGPTDMGRMWLWKATAKGNGEAPVLLADMYAQGKGVPKDCEQAMLLLNAAAKKVNVRARSKLGSMYAAGQCVPQDRVKAYKWMSAALEANPGSEWLEKNRETLLRDMTPAERQRASR